MDKLNEIALEPYLRGEHGELNRRFAQEELARRARQVPSEPYVPTCVFCDAEVEDFVSHCSASCRQMDDERFKAPMQLH